MKLTKRGRLHVGLCPFHKERTPSFTIKGDRFRCYGCDERGDIFDYLRHALGKTFVESVSFLAGGEFVKHERSAEAAEPEHNYADAARRIWMEAIDPLGTLTERYLGFRGYELPEAPVIRFHPRCPSPYGKLPAMICKMADPRTGHETGIHRTFLQPDGMGKASVAKAKMMIGAANPIQLYEWQGDGLGLAEGVETALAIAQIFEWQPIWAAGSAGMIRRFPVLAHVALSVFCDSDTSGVGLEAARECSGRYAAAGQEATIHCPPSGRDWDDQAREIRAS